MKLIKQSKLFFKEGNSDKIYEIDLCEISNGLYVVNFRFGRRGNPLKEGTKTDAPISLNSAEQVFLSLESEKKRKGYQTQQELSQFESISIATASLPDLPYNTYSENPLEAAILKRLKGFIENQNPYKTQWKPARVIWRAGELRLKKTVPFVLRLLDKGDEMQLYSALWTLGRCGEKVALASLTTYFHHPKSSTKIRRIAGAGLLQLLEGKERKEHLNHYIQQLPEDVRNLLTSYTDLSNLLEEKLFSKKHTNYDFLEILYLLSIEDKSLKKLIASILQKIPLESGYFRAVRHILKIAELRDDFEILGLLLYRFERSAYIYKSPSVSAAHGYEEIYRVKAELQKKESKLAYSDKTKAYLIRKALRQLKEFGEGKQAEYIKLAISVLVSYDPKIDYKAAYSNTMSQYSNKLQMWETLHKNYPDYYDAVLMNLILYGGGNRLTFTGKVWVNIQVETINRQQNWNRYEPSPSTKASPPSPSTDSGGILNRVFESIFGLFAQKPFSIPNATSTPSSEPPNIIPQKIDIVREELYPELWDKTPQAYIQLLLQAKVDKIHQFALQNLSQHPDYESIRKKIDLKLIRLFLASEYLIPARFGLGLATQHLGINPDRSFVLSLVESPLSEARELGFKIIEKDLEHYFEESIFVKNLLFSKYVDVRIWVKKILIQTPIDISKQQLLLGRAIAELSELTEQNDKNNSIIKDATSILLQICREALIELNNQILGDLLAIKVEATQLFVVKTIILKNTYPSAVILCSLLISPYPSVRKVGVELLTQLEPHLQADPAYSSSLVNYLVPILMSKQSDDALHHNIYTILSTQLVRYLGEVNLVSTLRLIHSNYRPAQELGALLLEKHVNPNQLKMKQIVDLGNHELVVFRKWCCQYYEQNLNRIKFERDEAIQLLDSKWEDTRLFAIQFFRQKFEAGDWSPEVLIGITDSTKSDIEALGKELISRFFEAEQGTEYLLKLSQHPSINVQLFATNYLERFAADDINKLQNLNFYFRSVLTRVNKGRSSKSRVFRFLHQEALKSEEAAIIISDIFRDISATASIEDKATCIRIMRDLQTKFEHLPLPLTVLDFEDRI